MINLILNNIAVKFLKNSGTDDDVYKIIRLKMKGKLSNLKHFHLLLNVYRNMKKEEKRFGLEINFGKMTKYLESL